MNTIPKIAQRLMSAKGFDVEFFNNLKISKTHIEAYEKTEKLYHSYFGRNRYKSYDSYRKVRNLRLKAVN